MMRRLLLWMFRNISPPGMLVIICVLCFILVVTLARTLPALATGAPS